MDMDLVGLAIEKNDITDSVTETVLGSQHVFSSVEVSIL